MGKQNKRIIFIVVLLVVAAAIWVSKNVKQWRFNAEKEFGIQQFKLLSNIEIQSQEGSLTLTKTNDGWLVNEQHPVPSDAIALLSRVLEGLVPLAPIPASVNDEILTNIEREGVHISLYSKYKRSKSFAMLNISNPNFGDVGVIRGAKRVYKLGLPGYDESLVPFFSTYENFWKQRNLALFPMEQMEWMEVEFPEFLDKSFRLDKQNEDYRLFNLLQGVAVEVYDRQRLETLFKSLSKAEYKEVYSQKELAGNLTQLECRVIFGIDKEVQQFSIYSVPIEPYTDEMGRKISFDPNHVYLMPNGEELGYLMSYMDLYPMLRGIGYLINE